MGKHEEGDYTFPCVVVRSYEGNLLSMEDTMRVLESKTVQGAMNVLADFGYGDGKELENPRDFQEVLKKNLDEAYKLVYSIIPDEKEMNLFLYPNDYHNAKVLLKSEFLKTDATPLLLGTGTIPPEEMEEMIRKRSFNGMSVEMRRAVAEAIDLFAKSRDPQEIDIILDKACYKDMLTDAEDSENEFVSEYIRVGIDAINVNTFIRLREIGKPRTFFQKVYLGGGNIDDKFFDNSYEEAYSQLAEKLAPFGFHDVFAIGAEQAHRDGKYVLLEKLLDDMKMNFVRGARLIPFGIEPLVGYLTAKDTENKNLRMILTGMIAGTDCNVTEERLRETYV